MNSGSFRTVLRVFNVLRQHSRVQKAGRILASITLRGLELAINCWELKTLRKVFKALL